MIVVLPAVTTVGVGYNQYQKPPLTACHQRGKPTQKVVYVIVSVQVVQTVVSLDNGGGAARVVFAECVKAVEDELSVLNDGETERRLEEEPRL